MKRLKFVMFLFSSVIFFLFMRSGLDGKVLPDYSELLDFRFYLKALSCLLFGYLLWYCLIKLGVEKKKKEKLPPIK